MAPGSRPQTVPAPLWPTEACTPRAATAGIAGGTWLPEGSLSLPGSSLPGSARGLIRAPGSREKALGRVPVGTAKSSSTAFTQESWTSFFSQPRSLCTTAAGTVLTSRSRITQASASQQGINREKNVPYITKGQMVVDKASGRKGLAKAVTRSHCKVDFDDVEEGDDGRTQITDISRLEIWTPEWEAGERLHCHPVQSSWFTRAPLPQFGQRRPVLGSLVSNLVSVAEEERDPVAEEKKALLRRLTQRFGGSVLSTWQNGLDTRQRGIVSFSEFSRALRNAGFTGNYSRAWKIFVGDEREEMRLADLEPAADLIEPFKTAITIKYSCVQELWESCLDKYGLGRCCFENFCYACSEASLDKQHARRLWSLLTHGKGSLTFEDLQFLGLPQREEAGVSQRRMSAKDLKHQKEHQLGLATLQHFRDFLSRRYGNLICAWRNGLDPDGDGKMQFAEFCSACRNVGFKGNLKRLWCVLDDDDSGFISVDELDPVGTELIRTFKLRITEEYPTLEEVWDKVLDPDKSGKCTLPEFRACCRSIDINAQDAKTLFRFFDASGGGDITMNEIDWIGIPRQVVQEASAAEKLAQKKKMRATKASNEINEFKAFLCRKYRNLVVAWRVGLDPDGDGKLQFTEFCAACRHMHYRGNLKALWNALDEDGTGFVTLDEVDPEAVEHLNDFTYLLSVFFGSIEEAWYSCLDRDGSERCTIEDFQRACKELGYFRAPKKLFKYLDTGCQGDITIDELFCLGLDHVSVEEGRRHAHDSGTTVRDDFRLHFSNKYKHNLCLAWRLCFCRGPPEHHWEETINSVHFCSVSRKEGFRGNMHAYWVWLSNSAGTTAEVTIIDIEPEGHEILRNCKTFLEFKYASVENQWFSLLEKCPRSEVTRKNFVEALSVMGFEDDAGYVFDVLDLHDRGTIYEQDLYFLTSTMGNKTIEPTKNFAKSATEATSSRKSAHPGHPGPDADESEREISTSQQLRKTCHF